MFLHSFTYGRREALLNVIDVGDRCTEAATELGIDRC